MQVSGEASDPGAASSPVHGFSHQALFYGSDEEFMDVAVPFIEEGLAADEPALVAVQERHVENLEAALGGTPEELSLFSVEQWHDTSARTREKYARWLGPRTDREHRRVRVIGEPPWAIGHQAQVRDWARHESVLNVAFEAMPVTFICPYDAAALPAEVIAHARNTHPQVVDRDGVSESDVYEDPIEFCRRLDEAIERPAGEPLLKASFVLADLPALRRLIASTGTAAGLTPSRADELVLAANEIATNALVHGRPPATVRIWRDNSELICEVSDTGDGIKQELPGQLTPATDAQSGRGIWLARMLCDAVEVRNGSGCVVSLHAATPHGSLT